MATITQSSWRKVEEKDFLESSGWLEDDVVEEMPLFKEFITPYGKKRPEIAIGGIYRLWKEFRGNDITYPLSLNDLKRLWTALSLLYPDNPLYSNIPEECIVYDRCTKAIINTLADVPAEQ
jgi:hypothetical protein